MKILLINNDTEHLINLRTALADHDVEVQNYRPGLIFKEAENDLVILSGGGGEGREAHDFTPRGKLWYEDEMHFVQACKKPIVGICMGFQVIAQSYGSGVPELKELVQGFREVNTTRLGKVRFARAKLHQLESHKWHVRSVSSKHFDVLADSPTGIEMIQHRKKPIIASQFHPEAGGSLELNRLVRHALSI